ncbi:uncharacterized protein [Macrobrachium rosenbergii]|uniref:uncharacterized protein n=1 Tax=Macrobrachium rosenbergii TaxID=79674 RepID=UPI0034D73C84
MGCGKSRHPALKSLGIGKKKKVQKLSELFQPARTDFRSSFSDVEQYTKSLIGQDTLPLSKTLQTSAEEEQHLFDDSRTESSSLKSQKDQETSEKEEVMETIYRSQSMPVPGNQRITKPQQPVTSTTNNKKTREETEKKEVADSVYRSQSMPVTGNQRITKPQQPVTSTTNNGKTREETEKKEVADSVYRSQNMPVTANYRQTKLQETVTNTTIYRRAKQPEVEDSPVHSQSNSLKSLKQDDTLGKGELADKIHRSRSLPVTAHHKQAKPQDPVLNTPINKQTREPEVENPPVNVEKASQSAHHHTETPKAASDISFVANGDLEGDEDHDEFEVKEKRPVHRGRRLKGCRGVMARKSSDIVVKYTRVYGESDGAYKNDSTPRGLVFMVNFTNYDGDSYSEREGSIKDFNNLLNLFQQMGYETSHKTANYCKSGYITKHRFLKMLREFSQEQRHRMLCSCVVIIMSHGSGPKTFVTSDNQEVDLMEVYALLDNMSCQNLRGKPKIFILQFCRNTPKTLTDSLNLTPSSDQSFLRALIRQEIHMAIAEQHENKTKWGDIDVRSPRFNSLLLKSENSLTSFRFSENHAGAQNNGDSCCQGNSDEDSTDREYQTDTKHVPSPPPYEGIQRFSDMYSIFSTASGELSHRDPKKGSLLIQAICHVFAEYAYQDEIDILVRKVSLYMTKTLQKDDPIHVPRQTCERTNNGLDKYFYFNPEYIPHCRHVTI